MSWRILLMSNKNLAILGLVLSLVVGGLPGLIVSAVALNKMKNEGDTDGKGIAIAGLVVGIVEMAIIVLCIACFGCAGCLAAMGGASA